MASPRASVQQALSPGDHPCVTIKDFLWLETILKF